MDGTLPGLRGVEYDDGAEDQYGPFVRLRDRKRFGFKTERTQRCAG